MRTLVDFILAVADLMEAEVRAVRRSVFRLAVAIGFACAALLLLVAALAMGTHAIFHVFVSAGLSPAGAAGICAGIFLCLSLVVLGVARWLAR